VRVRAVSRAHDMIHGAGSSLCVCRVCRVGEIPTASSRACRLATADRAGRPALATADRPQADRTGGRSSAPRRYLGRRTGRTGCLRHMPPED
jgi:hypothetical protein